VQISLRHLCLAPNLELYGRAPCTSRQCGARESCVSGGKIVLAAETFQFRDVVASVKHSRVGGADASSPGAD